ncbi:MAG: type II secretion system protein [Burkholderiales bacterium]
MSGTEPRRNRIANPAFFRTRTQATSSAPRVRIVPDPALRNGDGERKLPRFLLRRRREQGFTYIGVLLLIAIMGFGLSAFGELHSHAAQRDKERELLFVGAQFRDAIASYYNKSPGAKSYPKKLDDLVEDKRFPVPQHHLRRIYRDPMTDSVDWGIVEVPGGAGIMGVHSRSEAAPIKTADFAAAEAAFGDAENYTQWAFIYSPPGLAQGVPPSATSTKR